jgi:hypothetical protein
MTYILIVAGTALAFYAAAMFIIERENAATGVLGSNTESRAPVCWPGFSLLLFLFSLIVQLKPTIIASPAGALPSPLVRWTWVQHDTAVLLS